MRALTRSGSVSLRFASDLELDDVQVDGVRVVADVDQLPTEK